MISRCQSPARTTSKLMYLGRSFFIKGRARVTVFAAEGNARTFDYMAGDVGVVPRNMGVSNPS